MPRAFTRNSRAHAFPIGKSVPTTKIVACPRCRRRLIACATDAPLTVSCPKCCHVWILSAKPLGGAPFRIDEVSQPFSALIAEVYAELDRRAERYAKEEVRRYVESARAGRFVWRISTAEDILNRWQAAGERPDWADAG